MHKESNCLKICLMGGSQAGVVGALTLLSNGHRMIAAVSYFDGLTQILNFFKIPTYDSLKDKKFQAILKHSDLLINVHGREILNAKELGLPRLGCFNLHPYLYKYKGADPVGRALADKNFKGSVGMHRMTEKIDEGDLVVEEFIHLPDAITRDEIYNRLYPSYCIALLKGLDIIAGSAR